VESVEIYKRGDIEDTFESFISNKERDQGFVEFYDLEVEEKHEYFAEGVLVHNCHHVQDVIGMYGKTLQVLDAPVKIGTTATLPNKDKGKMCLEALIGPVIGEFTIHDAAEKGILAKPNLKIFSAPILANDKTIDITTVPNLRKDKEINMYRVVYHNAIVHHYERNLKIMNLAKKEVEKGKSVLINVINIDHGYNLQEIGSYWGENDPIFVHGGVAKEKRLQIKKDFENKKILCVIGTTIFNEGINLPSLDCCINAASGVSEIATIQKIGRGLRKTKQKNKVTIIDFVDRSHIMLYKQFKKREKIYKENNWL